MSSRSLFVKYNSREYTTKAWKLYYKALDVVKRDYQEYAVRDVVWNSNKKKVCIITNYRGSRKSYSAEKACGRWRIAYNITFIKDAKDMAELDAQLKPTRKVLWFTVKKHLCDSVLQGILCFIIFSFCNYYWKRFHLEENEDNDGNEFMAVIEQIWKFLKSENKIQDIAKPMLKFFKDEIAPPLVGAMVIVFARLARRQVIVVDDVLAMLKKEFKTSESSVTMTQGVLRDLMGMADKGYRVVLLSSNEGINQCFDDKCPSTKVFCDFPPPDAALLHQCMWPAICGTTTRDFYVCSTPQVIEDTLRVLPKHLALSMRLWTWVGVDGDRVKLIETLLQTNPPPKLSASQVHLLADLAMYLDLEAEVTFKEQALIYSPKYTNNDEFQYSIKVPRRTPRRLVLASALIHYYAAVEELMLLQLIVDALKDGKSDIVREVLNNTLTGEPTMDHVLCLVSKVKAQLTGVEKVKMGAMEVRWRDYEHRTSCEELKKSIIKRRRCVSWAVLPEPEVDKLCPSILDDLYKQLPVSTKPDIDDLRTMAVPLYKSVNKFFGKNNNNNGNNNNSHNNNNNNNI